MKAACILGLGLVLTPSAHAGGVWVEVMVPAEVDVPSSVRRVAVIDRSAAANSEQRVFSLVEGLLSGEGFDNDDRVLAADAMASMVAQLEASPRFEVVQVDLTEEQLQSELWARMLHPETVRAICRDQCDGLVSLESIDLDVDEPLMGMQSSSGDATWRLYEARSGTVLDTEDVVTDSLGHGGATSLIATLLYGAEPTTIGEASAATYAARIAPNVQQERRRLRQGSPELNAGVERAEAGDWEGAVDGWEAIGPEQGRVWLKARYNLAIAAEIEGDRDRAQCIASYARASREARILRRLSRDLEAREASARRLERQLASID